MAAQNDIIWMHSAIELAKKSAENNEVPVGAVLIFDNQIIGEGSNSPISQCDPTAHAEILALREGAKKINNYRLIDTTLYITLEPCVMCMGAIVHARVKRVVFGAYNSAQQLNHHAIYQGGILQAECKKLLAQFFQPKR